MVLLKIENCEKCTLLPPVGQLPSLRNLFIKGMASVKYNNGGEYIAFFLSYPVIFFDFTTRYQQEALANCCVLLIFNIKSHL
jgi:hypothetical protein